MSTINTIAFFNNVNYLLKHNSSCLCRDCITECEICGEFVMFQETNNESSYEINHCYDCIKMIKKDLLRCTSNSITNNLPVELVEMVLKYF